MPMVPWKLKILNKEPVRAFFMCYLNITSKLFKQCFCYIYVSVKKQAYLIILLISIVFSGYSQSNRNIDSIQQLLKHETRDTLKVRHLYKLCWEYSSIDLQKAREYGNKALDLAVNINYKRGIAAALNNIGNTYYYSDDYETAIEYYIKSYKIRDIIGDKRGVSDNLNNIGVLYRARGKYSEALDYFLKSLKIDEELKDTNGVAACYNNVGLIMSDLKNFPKAKEYYQKSVNTYKASNNIFGSASSLNNLAILYEDNNQSDSALIAFQQALVLYQKNKNQNGIAACLINIAGILDKKGDHAKAKVFAEKSLKIREDFNDKEGIASCLLLLAKIENDEGNFKKAKQYLINAISISKEIDSKGTTTNAYKTAAEIYYNNKNYKEAYDFYQLYSTRKDSLFNKESLKTMNDLQIKYETDKKQKEIELLKKGNKIQELENSQKEAVLTKQKYIIYSFVFIIIVVITFSVILYKALKERQKANKQLELAYSQIEEKNKHITDSINYAKRIQTAMLKDEAHSNVNLPKHFILYLPKDIVSGDFYWMMEKDHYLYLAAADCTGHGVPGAFLALLGTSFLNEITSSDIIHHPAAILNLLRDKIVKELGYNGQTKDGMDISLIRINLKTNDTMWAGAYNPLWIIKQGAKEFIEIKADKQPVGYSDLMRDFTNHELKLDKGDQLFLFTDGFADQFGGPKGKKFKYKQIQQALLDVKDLACEEQKKHLQHVFTSWKGNLDQVDDVLLLGVKI